MIGRRKNAGTINDEEFADSSISMQDNDGNSLLKQISLV